jgi:hypothetical protein
MAWLARAGEKAFVSTLTETGKISAAPTPCSARKAMTNVADGAGAHRTDASPNNPTPASSVRRRPKMSPMRLAGTMNAPRVSM